MSENHEIDHTPNQQLTKTENPAEDLIPADEAAVNLPNLDTQFQPPPDPGLSALEDLLKASEGTDAIGIALDPARAIFGSTETIVQTLPVEEIQRRYPGVAIPTPEEVAAIENGDRIPTIGGSLGVEDFISQGSGTSVMELPANIGPQPNGDYGVVVIVPEQMVSLVLGQAEMDGVSPSEWLSVRVGEYLETWAYGR